VISSCVGVVTSDLLSFLWLAVLLELCAVVGPMHAVLRMLCCTAAYGGFMNLSMAPAVSAPSAGAFTGGVALSTVYTWHRHRHALQKGSFTGRTGMAQRWEWPGFGVATATLSLLVKPSKCHGRCPGTL
jgi:hypothetical protein